MKLRGCAAWTGKSAGSYRWPVVLLALFLDTLWGDPPSRFHPVAWMGQWITLVWRRAPHSGPLHRFFYGATAIIGSGLVLALAGRQLIGYLHRRRYPWTWLIEAGLLSLLISWRGLLDAGEAVACPLRCGDLAEARRQLGWHLVSRETVRLSDRQVAAAAIESLAENTSDGVIAPLFWYGVAGLPGALAYRFLNTADAMLGYRDEEREWLGKAAARLDDAANFIPARLTALFLIAAAPFATGDAGRAWRIWRRDAGKTASPNAGHPMSATAGALEVELEKVDHYRLGAGLPLPTATDIQRAQRLITNSICLGAWLTTLGWLLFTQRNEI